MTMPWGIYKGKQIDQLPSSYLKWLAENCNDPELCCAADEEYIWRSDYNGHFYD